MADAIAVHILYTYVISRRYSRLTQYKNLYVKKKWVRTATLSSPFHLFLGSAGLADEA